MVGLGYVVMEGLNILWEGTGHHFSAALWDTALLVELQDLYEKLTLFDNSFLFFQSIGMIAYCLQAVYRSSHVCYN